MLIYVDVHVTCCDLQSSESDIDNEEDDNEDGIGETILLRWKAREVKLISDPAITAWALAISPDIRKDVASRLTGNHRDAVEKFITKLFSHDVDCNIARKIDLFWDEFKHWQNRTGMFSNVGRFNTSDAVAGRSASWHAKYSLPHTEVLGIVACRSTSNHLGIGSAERSWGDVKHLKTDKRSHLSADKTEKQSVLYTTARIEEARVKRTANEKVDAKGEDTLFGDDDLK